jgi:hypothetical protein
LPEGRGFQLLAQRGVSRKYGHTVRSAVRCAVASAGIDPPGW